MPADLTSGGLQETLNKVKDWFGENPRMTNSLMAGLGSAAVGGGLSAFGRERAGESRAERRKRILRNALLAGAAGAGAYGLTSYGLGQWATADPSTDDPVISPMAKWIGAGTGTAATLGAYRGGRAAENISRRTELRGLAAKSEKGPVGKIMGSWVDTSPGVSRAANRQGVMGDRETLEKLLKLKNSPLDNEALRRMGELQGFGPGKVKGWGQRFANRILGRNKGWSKGRAGAALLAAGAVPYWLVKNLSGVRETADNTWGGFKEG